MLFWSESLSQFPAGKGGEQLRESVIDTKRSPWSPAKTYVINTETPFATLANVRFAPLFKWNIRNASTICGNKEVHSAAISLK